MIGRVDVFDTRKKKIAFAHLRVAEPLGNKPESERARRAVVQVAEDFAKAAEHALIHLPKGQQGVFRGLGRGGLDGLFLPPSQQSH